METIKLAILTDDEEYGRALSKALVNIYKTFTVTLYKTGTTYKETEVPFDLILRESATEGEREIQLVEKPSLSVKNYDSREFRLYKYSNVRELAGELLHIYSVLTGRKAIPIKNEDLKIVLMGTAGGGSGCTSAAMALAQNFKRFHRKKVLYLSLEEIESTLEYMEPFPGGKNIGEYLYYLFNEKEENAIPFLESFLVLDHYGVEAFSPSMGRNLLNTLSAEEMQYFISTLINSDLYDYIIIDAGCNIGKGALCCYEMANVICLIENLESTPYKTNRLLEYLMFLKGETILKRIGKIQISKGSVKKNEEEKEEKEENRPEEMIGTICTLPYEKDSFFRENQLHTISLDGAYGFGIGKLANTILRNQVF